MSFATKYRPTTFDQVVGQPEAVKSLRGLISKEDFPAALLFCGDRSTGKTTLARLVCLYLNCQGEEDEPCGTCKSCVAMLAAIQGDGDHPDLVEKNAASDRGIEMIRELEKTARYSPRFKRRIILLDEAHMLTDQAQQASLKLLEEPPSKRCTFILCTTNPEKLLGAIMSRCTVFQLADIPVGQVARLVHRVAKLEKVAIPKAAAVQIAEAAHGHPREALTLLQQVCAVFDGRAIDLKELPTVIEASETVQPTIAVQQWIRSILLAKYGNALLATQRVGSADYFCKMAIEAVQMLLRGWIDADKLVDRSKFWLLKNVPVPKAPDDAVDMQALVDTWADILGLLLDAQERVKRYQNDGLAVLDHVTCKVVARVKR